MSDNAFFEELQGEFLTESAFMLEQYEESMLGLENGTNPQDDLGQIFRVAHSIKGGAAAVGFADLGKFAHVVEDLLALLRVNPSHVNSNVISVLLKSGDMFKSRIIQLQTKEEGNWDTAELVAELKVLIEQCGGEASGHAPTPAPAEEPVAESAIAVETPALNFDVSSVAEEAVDLIAEAIASGEIEFKQSSGPVEPVASAPVEEDFTNHELLAELNAQMAAAEAAAPVLPAKPSAPPAPVAQAAPAQPKLAVVPPPPVNQAAPTPAATKPAAEAKAEEKAKTSGGGGSGSNNKATTSIKVDTGRVDSVLDAVGELVVLKNQIVHDESIRSGGNVKLAAIIDQLDKTVRELYDKTLSIRMTPLKSLFLKIQRIVRDVSLNLHKPVDLILIGEETEVERTVFELLGDPLVHLVRNSMDHGIEKPEIRKEKGKSETAKVTVSAKQTGGTVTIEIIDDGGGINRDRVLQKAIEKKLVPSGVDPQSLSDEAVFQFIFAPGFSTAEKVTDLSGRGVGLDVVRSNLERINGKIDIKSKAGVGTTFRLSIPLSTAITDGIVVAIENAKYILPIYAIREIVRVLPKDYTVISGGGKIVKIREVLMPVIDISESLGKINWEELDNMRYTSGEEKESLRSRREETMLVIIESIYGMMALPVDEVIGQAQVVVKPITTGLGQQIPEVAGAAILGDGRTVLILDPTAMTQQKKFAAQQESAA